MVVLKESAVVSVGKKKKKRKHNDNSEIILSPNKVTPLAQKVLWNVKGGLFFIFLPLTCTCFLYFKNIQVASLVKKVDFENLYQNKTRGSFTDPSVTGSLHQ